MTSGWQNSDLIIIAARPAMGKTAFVLSMAKNMAVNNKIPVALFSLEMSNVQLVNRLIVNVCEIPGEKIKSGQLAPYEWGQLDYKIKELYDAPLYVDDTPSSVGIRTTYKGPSFGARAWSEGYHNRLLAVNERQRYVVWQPSGRG